MHIKVMPPEHQYDNLMYLAECNSELPYGYKFGCA